MNKEFLKMQKLAGIITESQYKKRLNENRFKVNPDQIVFKSSPTNPNEILTQHDGEYLDPDDSESEYFTKEDFWKSDVSNFDNNGGIISANKMPNGTWKFTWDSGEISGFKEGEDFEFNKGGLNENRFNDEDKALGTIFYPSEDEEGTYTYDDDAVTNLIKSMGYEDYEEVAKEVTHYTSPGDKDEMRIFRTQENNPKLQPTDLTIGMYKREIEREFEK